MYKAIIFDFFDVIHRDPFHHWLKESGLERGGKLHESSKQLDIGAISDEEHFAELGRLSGQSASQVRQGFAVAESIDFDMVALLKQLKQSYKTCLLSNTSTTYLPPILEKYELAPLFDEIIISANVGMIKPDPKIFKHALAKLGVKAEEAVFIDDNPKNVEAAQSIGIAGITFTNVAALKPKLNEIGVKF